MTEVKMTGTPPAGWYPAPHANNESRYWDGQGWVEPVATTNPPTGAQPYSTQTLVAPVSAQEAPRSLAIAALVLGIVAFLTGLVPWLGLLLAIGAVVLGILALVKKQKKSLAIIGTALGGIALIAGLAATILFTAAVGVAGTIPRAPDVAPSAEAAETTIAPEEPVVDEDEVAAEEPEPVEAAAPAGTAESPFPQPYVAKGLLGGEKYSLVGRIVDANGNALVEGWNQFNSDAPAGFKYVVVELTMTGIDPDGVEPSLAAWDLSLATSEGNQYSGEFIVLGEGMASMSDGPTLYPGSVFTGLTTYLVPESAQSFLLHDNGNYISF